MPFASRARTTVRITALLMAIIVVALTAFMMIFQYRVDTRTAEVKAHRDAHLAALQMRAVLDACQQALQRVSSVMAFAEATPSDQEVHDIELAVRDLPKGLVTSVYSADGDLLLSSLKSPSRGNVADRPYFYELRDGQNMSISPVVVDRNSGSKVIVVAKRIERSGAFAGVATVAIPMSSVVELAELLGLGHDTVLSIVRLDGEIIARHPPVTVTNIRHGQLFDELKKAPNGVFYARSTIDGFNVIAGYWSVDGWPLVAGIALNSQTALASFARQARTSIWIELPALAALVWLMFHLSQILKGDERRRLQLEVANERANRLLREIHHRVKNNLQTVTSLIRMETIPKEMKRSLLSRIGAMAAVHEGMYGSDQFETVEVAPYLERLVSNVAAGYGGNVTIDLQAAPISLLGDRAMQLGLLVNEVVSNSFKHAFQDGQPGRLTLRLIEDGPMLVLTIEDDGPGFDPENTQANMGSRLVEAFADQLGGTLSIDSSDGTKLRLVFPRVFEAV